MKYESHLDVEIAKDCFNCKKWFISKVYPIQSLCNYCYENMRHYEINGCEVLHKKILYLIEKTIEKKLGLRLRGIGIENNNKQQIEIKLIINNFKSIHDINLEKFYKSLKKEIKWQKK